MSYSYQMTGLVTRPYFLRGEMQFKPYPLTLGHSLVAQQQLQLDPDPR